MAILKDTCQLKYAVGALSTEQDMAVTELNVKYGSFDTLLSIANDKIDSEVWESAWIFPAGSDSSFDATHPGNPYWSGDSSGWHHLDE